MKILANDVITNIPGSRNVTSGGTGNLTAMLAKHAIKKSHSWAGLCLLAKECKRPSMKNLYLRKNHSYTQFIFPYHAFHKIIHATRGDDPRQMLHSEISVAKKFIKNLSPDIVFLNGFSLFGWVMLIATNELSIPIVTKHGGIWKVELDLYKDQSSTAGRRIMIQMEKDSSELSNKELFLNQASLSLYREILKPNKPTSPQVMGQPLPPMKQCVQNKKQHTQEINIGMVARWDRIKNYKAYFDIAEKSHQMKLSWVFHAVCRFPPHPTKRLSKQFQTHVKIHVPMKKLDLYHFYDQMDLMILPSIFDVMPHVIIEAASRSVGTLISPTVGWSEVFRKTKNKSWIDNFDDTEKTIKRIKALLKKQGLSTEFYTYVKKHMQKTDVLNAYLDVFSKVIQQKKIDKTLKK